MSARFGRVVLLVAVWWMAVPTVMANKELQAAVTALNKHFKEIDATVRIPLPFSKVNMFRVEVSTDGELDMALYRKRLGISDVSFQPGDHVRRLFFKPKPKEGALAVSLLRKNSPYPKAVLGIMFGHKLRAEDVTRENVVRALSGILDIEGESVTIDSAFDAAALEALLEEVPSSVPAGLPGTAAPERRPSAEPLKPVLTVLSAEVEPVRVRRGERFEMILHFEIAGVQSGRALPLTEERQIFFGDRALLPSVVTTTADWGSGRHSTHESLKLPGNAPLGVYRLEVTVRGAGGEQTAEALFEAQE